MTPHHQAGGHERLHATAEELETMSELIQRYPAEAQLIMSALEDGLRLGPMRVMAADDNPDEATAGYAPQPR